MKSAEEHIADLKGPLGVELLHWGNEVERFVRAIQADALEAAARQCEWEFQGSGPVVDDYVHAAKTCAKAIRALLPPPQEPR